MSRVYRTVKGKPIDIDKIKLANETTVAVGNMRVNARGDVLGANNQIVASRNQVMDQVYSVNPGYSPTDPKNFKNQQAILEAANAKKLNEIANNLVVSKDQAAEQPEPAPTTRGSLASSVAKQSTVVQEPLPKPEKKKDGPSRI